MKKILISLALGLLLIGLAGCAKKDVDPYAIYRNKTSDELFNGGEKALAHKKYDIAVKQFEALDAIYPFGPHAQQGQLDIIYAYYMNDDEASSTVAADRYIRLYPRGRNVDYAYYMRGIVGFNQGLSWLQKMVGVDPAPRDISTIQQSFSSFDMVVTQFPDSYYAPDAMVRMTYIRNLLARREVMTAQFYFEHQAYVAAANRASYVVQHFEGSPQVVKALAVMVKSYRALRLTQMANNTYAILQASYPQSDELRELNKN
jgi:outer membrane protein assembly factor BamD